MDAEALVLAVLNALPRNEVRGRKRLQKLAYFAINAGTETDVNFFLHDYGPFSAEVAGATDLLTFTGDIQEEDAQFDRSKRHYKIYRLSNQSSVPESLPEVAINTLITLNDYSTTELEIASTIRYFILKGLEAGKATEETRQLKPTKSAPAIIKRAEEALMRVNLHERGRAD